jgi:hypothetical protein
VFHAHFSIIPGAAVLLMYAIKRYILFIGLSFTCILNIEKTLEAAAIHKLIFTEWKLKKICETLQSEGQQTD